MKKTILTMDDIRPGMYVTVLYGKKTYRTVRTPMGEQVISREKDTYKGSVLEVISLDLPYIVVRYFPRVTTRKGDLTDILDLRDVTLKRLSPVYIVSLFPDFNFNRDHFWDGIKDTSLEDADTTIEKIFKDL